MSTDYYSYEIEKLIGEFSEDFKLSIKPSLDDFLKILTTWSPDVEKNSAEKKYLKELAKNIYEKIESKNEG